MSQFTPNAGDQILDPATGQFTEIGRILVRNLSAAVGALAPIDAEYWVSTPDATLTNDRNIGALASGYLKIVSAAGIATPSTVAVIPQADITGLVAALALLAPIASPTLTGVPAAPTAAPGTNTTQLATTAFVTTADALKAPLASPALTGTPTAPTAAVGTSTTQLATTAFVAAAVASGTYTPTLFNDTNLSASTAYSCQYLRVGNTVTVSGRADVDPTAAAVTKLGVSLPIASTFANPNECAGTGASPDVAGQCAGIFADVANARASVQWVAVDLANRSMFFQFSYRVI